MKMYNSLALEAMIRTIMENGPMYVPREAVLERVSLLLRHPEVTFQAEILGKPGRLQRYEQVYQQLAALRVEQYKLGV